MDWLYLIGRILFGMLFVGSGFGHFAQAEGMSGYAASKGVPAPKAMVLLSGLMILLGGLSVILGVGLEIGTWLLVFFLLPAAFMVHDFWTVADPMEKSNQQAHFMKNIALVGAALILYWMVQTFDSYGPLALGRPL